MGCETKKERKNQGFENRKKNRKKEQKETTEINKRKKQHKKTTQRAEKEKKHLQLAVESIPKTDEQTSDRLYVLYLSERTIFKISLLLTVTVQRQQ